MPELLGRADRRRWTRGLIVVGALDHIADRIDPPPATLASSAGTPGLDNSLAAVRIGGLPALLVTDAASARIGRLFGNPSLAALRDTQSASVGEAASPKALIKQVSFDELGVASAHADVFGRAELSMAIANRALPSGTRPSRFALRVMVAPDGAGEKAVVSAFVNERLLASAVAAIGEPTQLDFALPDGLVGTAANLRVVVQRRSAQGDCRFEPQGYPAEILGSSSIVLSPAKLVPTDFSDLAPLWAGGVEVFVPASAATEPLKVIGLLANVLNPHTKESTKIAVRYVDAGATPTPTAAFILVGDQPPAGVEPRVRFDHGRVVVNDRSGNTRLDIGGLSTGAVAQIVTSGVHPGLWIKSLASDATLPTSPEAQLDRGDVAFLDRTGVALAMSTERDTLLRISYPDNESWSVVVTQYSAWIIGGLWALVTVVVLIVLPRAYRRRRAFAARK